MFWRKSTTFQDPDLGSLTYRGRPREHWVSGPVATSAGEVLVSVPGNSSAPDATGLIIARQVLSQAGPLLAIAVAYVQANAAAREFVEDQGEWVLDGFSFTETPGTFELELTRSNWPDAMIGVTFNEGVPCGVLLAD